MRWRSRSTSGSTKYLSTLAMAFALVMWIVCCSSCGKPEEPKPTPTPVNPSKPDEPPTPPADKDTKAPTITLVTSSVGIYGGKVVTIEAGKLSIGETEVASWTDDKSAADKCTVVLSFAEAGTKADADTKAWTAIKSGDTLDKAGPLMLTVSDEAGNSASKDITLTEDNSAPEVKVLKESVDVYGGKAVIAKDNTLSIGEDTVLQWTDDHGDECTLTLSLDGEAVSIGGEVSKAGTLKVTVTDSKGLGTEASITLTEDNSAPEVKVLKESVNVYGGKAVTAKDNTLSIGDEAVLQWTDDHGDECTLTLALDGAAVSIGDEVSKAGTLKVTVTDSKGLGTEASITLTDQIVFGMDNLKNLDLQIDKEVNLIGWLSFYEGWSLAKVEIETNGSRTEVTDPEHYIPAAAGSIYVIITVTDGAKTAEFKSDALTVKPMQYAAVQFEKADAAIYKKREDQKATLVLDDNDYKEWHTFFENVGLVEWNAIDEILDKIWWTEREAALSRLYYCDVNEVAQNWNPWTDWLRERIGYERETTGDWHCNGRLNIVKSNKEFPWIAQPLKNKMLCAFDRGTILQEAKSHPNNTYVVWNAVSVAWEKRTREEVKDNHDIKKLKELSNLKNVIICNAIPDNRGEGSNIYAEEWYETNKYVCTYWDRAPKWDRIFHTGGCSHNKEFNSIDWKPATTSIWLWEDPAIVMPQYPMRLKNWTTYITDDRSSSYNCFEAFVTKIWTQNPNLSADQVIHIINNNLIDVPVYWNGKLFTEMKAKTLDFLGILKDLHLPQLPAQISSSQASALPSSPTGLYVFYEGKGVMGLWNGSLVPTTADNFPDTQSILDAARSGGFVFDPELFQKQGGDPSSATITQHIITLDGKTISRLVQTTTLQVTLP